MDNVTRPHLVEVLSEQQQAFLVMALQVQEKKQDKRGVFVGRSLR